MKKFLLPLILIFSAIWLLGCTAETPEAQAANPVVVERATAAPTAAPTVAPITGPIDPHLPPKYCAVTQPPEEAFVPPAPFKQEPYPGQFFYGTEALWTAIPLDQTWYSLPTTETGGFGQKLFFQRVGYDWMEEQEPALTVTGRKIDLESSEEVALNTSRATNGYTPDDGSFMLVGAEIPTTGCWEITGRYGDDELTYTIWVTH